ncbi:hypothetical protein SAMN05519103_02322 [Rhizobiales bacterium GAS113]|nr:hypothetical protein SAMN05519103_02322 [Rhizobiales bacterium GAS113]
MNARHKITLVAIGVVIHLLLMALINLNPTSARSEEPSNRFGMDAYFTHFNWQKENNTEIAVSLPQQNFSYQTIGTLEFAKRGVEGELIPRLARIAGLSVVEAKDSKEPIKIFIIKDVDIINIVKSDPDKLRRIGIPNAIVSSLQSVSPGTPCKGASQGNNDDHNIVVTVILSADKSEKCLANIIYNAFGIINPSEVPSADLSLCILYEARWRGKRTREEIASVFDDVKKTCETRIPEA